jgi:hypothetical protein
VFFICLSASALGKKAMVWYIAPPTVYGRMLKDGLQSWRHGTYQVCQICAVFRFFEGRLNGASLWRVTEEMVRSKIHKGREFVARMVSTPQFFIFKR